MKRLALLLAGLMIAAPVFAKDGLTRKQEKNLAKFKKAEQKAIEADFALKPTQGAFEMTCYPEAEFGGSSAFVVDLSTAGPKDIPLNTEILKGLKDLNGFCILGPINVAARKQAALKSLDAQIEYFRIMLRIGNRLEKLHGNVAHPQPK